MGHIKQQLRAQITFWKNRRNYQGELPYFGQRIWINPQSVTHSVKRNTTEFDKYFTRNKSGLILPGDWDLETRPVTSGAKYKACKLHFIDGLDWSETGIYDNMMQVIARKKRFDGCQTLEDVVSRYQKMDTLWASIREKGMLSAAPIDAPNPKEPDGVLIHIGRDGQPLFGATGHHRFAICRLMGLDQIPAQLGLIHADAYTCGKLENYKKPRLS